MSAATEGWAWPLRANKPHYFRDSQSLCGRWASVGPFTEGFGQDGDCQRCRERLGRPAGFVIVSTPRAVTCSQQPETRQ